MKAHEGQYHKTGRPLIVLLGLSFPVLFQSVVGFATARVIAYRRWKHFGLTLQHTGRN